MTTCFPDFSTLPAIFNIFFTVFQYFSSLNSSILTSTVFFKKILCSSTEYKERGRNWLNLHAHFYCIPAWCVRTRTMYSSIECVKNAQTFMLEKRTSLLCSSIIYKQSYISSISSILFCMHFHCVPALVTCISIAPGGFLDCFGMLLGSSSILVVFQ